MNLKTLEDMGDLSGKRVFVRVDFNVPLDEAGNVRDDKRIKFAIPTLKYLLEHGASRLVLASHLGRPKNNEPELKTDKVAAKLAELLGEPVSKADDWGEKGLPEAKIVMLENIRFHPAEKSKDEAERDAFGKQLAGLADFYVNEAFSNSHRKHASMTSIPKFIPGYAGFGVEKEVKAIGKALSDPEHPLIAVIGGLKADKIKAIHNLMGKADKVLVAGALACNLLKAKGYEIGASKADNEGMEEQADLVKEVVASDKVELPTDFVVADAFEEKANVKTVPADGIEPGWMAMDIGPESAASYAKQISQAKTVLWFGPIGVFEMAPFAGGTKAVGEAMAALSGVTIIGGGDSASAVKKLGLSDKMTLVSTGGGASLEMIEGKELPALKVLKK
ncbi:phosphoglycerate kinase [Patescibacteria group bacterium]|nr:phosphoglycerate kinase [Patescibacteria group bacterium]MBU1015526.1 phosphoglycerate kinase [Patescibacteria group bacterium]MBU1685644.1 phosphoglycerate kinase [Patescibacteria group bacterium]MBU1938137.1 phosphoglycerate kinase [Patescibacteria group bacterium]